MSASSDVEKLFGHFGGNAGDYQEIGRENEARTARTRWPLLVTLDLRQPSIPAIVQRRAPAAQPTGAPGAGSETGGARQTAAPQAAAPLNRGKPPLFARPHRHHIPAVAAEAPPGQPRGAARFAELPEAQQAPTGIEPAAPMAAADRKEAAAAPVVMPFAGNVTSAPSMPGAAASVVAPVRAVPPREAPAPARPAAQPASTSILGKLFAPEPARAQPAPAQATQAAPVPLNALFDRLRGADTHPAAPPAGTPAPAPAPNSWLLDGPRRS